MKYIEHLATLKHLFCRGFFGWRCLGSSRKLTDISYLYPALGKKYFVWSMFSSFKSISVGLPFTKEVTRWRVSARAGYGIFEYICQIGERRWLQSQLRIRSYRCFTVTDIARLFVGIGIAPFFLRCLSIWENDMICVSAEWMYQLFCGVSFC